MKKKNIIASVYPFPFFIGEGHDTNFSLIVGNDIFSCEEGKINSVVNSQCDRFPEKSMLSAFKHFGIYPSEVDNWVFGSRKYTEEKPALTYFFSKFKAKNYDFLKSKKKIFYSNHHLAHASLGIYGSGFKNGLFICLDNGGDESFPYDTLWGTFEDNKISILGKYNKGGWGLSRFHNFICEAVNYLGNYDNGKVMGLAAYGNVKKNVYSDLKKFVKISNDGLSVSFLLRHNKIKSIPRLEKLKLDAYQSYKVLNSPNPHKDLKEITKYYSSMDIAATGQKLVEDMALTIIRNMIQKTGKKNLICSGGFFQNILLNTRLLDLKLDKVYIPSAPNDAGLSLGAALHNKMMNEKSRPKIFLSSYLGPEFSNNEIEILIKDFNLNYKKSKNICLDTAKLLKKGKIVGWFQGRSELGPRALGARSVLADPRNINNKARINQLLKKRDWFMPYAPSILSDKMNLFFKNFPNSPYMSFALNINKNFAKIAAAVHIDKTCRPQSVSKNNNKKFYKLIENFYKLTKVPAVLNTSFNRHGISTIVTPRQAIEHLLNGCVDILSIGDFLVYKNKNKNFLKEKIYNETKYVFVEKILHICEAILKNDGDLKKIILSNKNFLNKHKIKINLNNKTLQIDNKKIKIKNFDRDYLWKNVLPNLKASI